ncbi:MAG: ankyrin repeat domain-containing protein [Candidatus Aminicenantaceae bacterium]
MKKATSIVLLVFLSVTFLVATLQKNEEMNRKLRGAIIMGKIDEVKSLIKAGVNVNDKFDVGQNRGLTPLILVAQFGKADIGKLLIEAGADVDVIFQSMTLLHLAAFSPAGNEAVTELFIAEGLDVNAKCTAEVRVEIEGVTPLHLAAATGKAAVAEALIRNGAEVNAKDKNGDTPLDLAKSKENEELADLLRKHGGISGRK